MEAEDIYLCSYWGQSSGDLLPPRLAYAVFNSGVVSGPSRALKILQSIVRVRAANTRLPRHVVSGRRRYRHSGLLRRYMRFLWSLTNRERNEWPTAFVID